MVSQNVEIKKVRSYCAQCGSQCPTVYKVKDGILVKVEPDRANPAWVPLCPKGVAGPELVYDPQRLKYPMRRTNPKDNANAGWERITWDDALNTVARKLTEVRAKFGPHAIAFCRTSPGGSPGGDMHEWVTRLANVFGTPNTITHTHVCQWHRDNCSNYTYGRGGIGVPDFDRANCVLIWGANIYANDPRRFNAVKKAQQRGAKLIVVDPRKTPVAARADLWLRINPGTDGALVLGLINILLKAGLFDREFTRDWTNAPFLVRRDNGMLLRERDLGTDNAPLQIGGAESRLVMWDETSAQPAAYDPASRSFRDGQVKPALSGSYKVNVVGGGEVVADTVFELLSGLVSEYTLEKTEAITGVPAEKIEQAAAMIGSIKPLCYYTFTGLEQHTNVSQTNRALCILYALTGNYDAAGGNMQLPALPVNRILSPDLLSQEARRRRLGYQPRPLGPAAGPGSVQAYDLFTAILDEKPYPVKALVAFGGDLLIADSNSLLGREALRKLDFYVHIDLHLSPPALLADMVLPASTFYECEVPRLGFTGSVATWDRLQWRAAAVLPQNESRPDLDIVFDLANRLELGEKFWHGRMEDAFNYLLAPSGITAEQLRNSPGGLSLDLPLPARKYQSTDRKTGEVRGFETSSKRIEIYSETFKAAGHNPLPAYEPPHWTKTPGPEIDREYPLTLVSTRVIQYCHGQQRSLPSLRKAVPDPFLELHPETAKSLEVADGEWVYLETDRGRIRVKAKVTDMVPSGVVSTQVGWWEGCEVLGMPGLDPFSSEGANLNLILADDVRDPISGSLPFKSYRCRVRKLP